MFITYSGEYIFNMCINTMKSRNKCHDVVYFLGGWRYAINDPREGGGNPALSGTRAWWKTCTHSGVRGL